MAPDDDFELGELKAVFFVRDFAGRPDSVEETPATPGARGRKIQVTFRDGEVMVGTTLNYQAIGSGFFLAPLDPKSNNVRCFVVNSAVQDAHFVA